MVVEDEKSQETLIQNINPHPLDPLSLDEITQTSLIVKSKGNLGKELLFETIMLREPSKKEVLSFNLGDPFSRNVFVVVLNYIDEKVFELDIALDSEEITRCEHIPNVQPAFMCGDLDMDFNDWENKIKHDSKLIEPLKKRGINNPDLLMIDPWPISNFGNKEEEGKKE